MRERDDEPDPDAATDVAAADEAADKADDDGDGDGDGDDNAEDAIAFDPGDVLDLHSFPPAQVREIVRDYLDLAAERGYPQVRIVHGRGVGVQREAVRRILAADPRVESFGDAPAEAGGWGATWARLRP